MAKYIIRLDDICENMNWDNFFKLKSIFLNYDIKPLLGVIPSNSDVELLKYPKYDLDFWSEIKNLKEKKGWSIALHGYNHVFETKNSGILKINFRSEFAGLPKEKQNEKISKGREIFNRNGLKVDAFMAPAHSFDRITMECLKKNEINIITDGHALFPYYEDDILFVPQLFSEPRKMPFGLYTWCLHLNSMSDKNIEDLEKFIKNNNTNIISFNESRKYVIGHKSKKFQKLLLKNSILFFRKLKRRRGSK